MAVINVVPIPLRTVVKVGRFMLPEDSIIPYVKKKIDNSILGEETYILEVKETEITITAANESALFRGWQTLKQIIYTSEGGFIPCLKIEDSPRFSYRSFMIDSSRHMQSIDEIKRMIDVAALFKFNVFHWHLSDDQGFRMEIDAFPKLMEVGSVRQSSNFGNNRRDEEYGGYYTKDEMRDIVKYASQRYIEVIPELDMPGHTTSLISSYPHLSCTGEEIPLRTTAGVFPEILCAGKESTYEFIFKVLDEIIEIFPSPYIHIGGDEAPKTFWAKCPDCQEKIRYESLFNEEELQGYFVNRIIDYLSSKGKTAICWNESLKSGLVDNRPIIQMWMDREGLCIDYANNGGRIIVSDFFHYYTDYPYAMTSLNKTYSYEPVLNGILPVSESNVLGVETCIWTEYVENFEKMAYMTYPRFAAVAETAWSYAALKDKEDFNYRIRKLIPLLKSMGINMPPISEWNPMPAKKIKDMFLFFTNNINKEAISSFIETKREEYQV